jgi:uncharacterized phage infection (PIP) family protein YhgE
MRRFLGVLVMIAGIVGLVLSLTGLIGLFVLRPRLAATARSTLSTFSSAVNSSQQAVEITSTALDGAIESVNALSSTLTITADSVQETQPVISQVNTMMGIDLPATLQAATDSLTTAGEAATSLEGAIKSLDAFRAVVGAVPLLNAIVPPAAQPYNPDKPLADSLDELAQSLKDMPASFEDIAANIDKADDNLTLIQTNLTTMADSVAVISGSLQEYQSMVSESNTSMTGLKTMLDNTQANLDRILTWATIILALFLFWLLAAQAVIFSQGWELYMGTASRMEGGAIEVRPAEKI